MFFNIHAYLSILKAEKDNDRGVTVHYFSLALEHDNVTSSVENKNQILIRYPVGDEFMEGSICGISRFQ